jgi:hypothetical protein
MIPGLLLSLALVGAIPAGGQPKPDKAEPYVEFDFSTLPQGGEGRYSFTFTVSTTDKDLKLSEPASFSRQAQPESVCEGLASFMNRNRFKAEVVDKTKLRVYGRTWNDTLIPATEGRVESKDLKPEELPKVKNPPKA